MRLSLTSRITAVLSGILLVQLMLLASGTLCRMHAGHQGMMSGANDHGGQMHQMQMTSNAMHDVSGMAVVDASANAPSASCDMSGSCGAPWAPSSGCASMASCISAVSATPSVSVARAADVVTRVAIVASAAMPRGPAFAPELPPPRA